MSDITAWIFPRTLPQESVLTPLVHVFPSLVYLQSVEQDPDCIYDNEPVLQAMIEARRLKLSTPAPLSEDRDRFLSLVADVRNRRDDYRAMLSSLSLANMGTDSQSESKHSIISQLVGSTATRKPEHEALDMLLWQARLVLKLGEMLDRDQDEIASELESLNEKQDTLFAELREETNEPFALTRDIGDMIRGSDEMLDHRLKAWTQLFCLGEGNLQEDVRICVTTRLETLEKIRDQYEKSYRATCLPSIQIELPVLPLAVDSDSGKPDLPSPSPALIQLCQQLLAGDADAGRVKRLVESWEEELENLRGENPNRESSSVSLTLQPFHGVGPDSLLLETFTRSLHDAKGKGNGVGCIIGALEAC